MWPYSQQVLGKSLIYQLLPIISEKLGRPKSSKAIIVIVSPLVALMDDQVKEVAKLSLCAAQLGMHNDREIMEGNFSLFFGSPESWILNPKWQAMLASTLYQDNLVAIVVWRGTRHIQMVSLHTGVWLLTSTCEFISTSAQFEVAGA